MYIRPLILIGLLFSLCAYILMLSGYQLPYEIQAQTIATPTINAAEVPAKAPVPDISKTPASQIAIRDKLLSMLVPGNPNSVFTVIDTIEADRPLSLSCHEIAHDLGHRAYEMYGFSGAMNFTDAARLNHASVQDICAGGYVHGILEEAALRQSNFAEHPGALCEGVAPSNRAGCFHGVGHALMFTYYRDAQKALAGCRIDGNINDKSRCFEGVWMEFFWGSTKYAGSDSLGWDLNAPLAPCVATDKDAKHACFIYAAFGYLRTHAHDYAGAVQLCTQSKLDEENANYCLKGVGITMISHFGGKHLEQSEPFVDGQTYEGKYAFYQGVTGYAILSGIPQRDITVACNSLIYDGDVCLSALSSE